MVSNDGNLVSSQNTCRGEVIIHIPSFKVLSVIKASGLCTKIKLINKRVNVHLGLDSVRRTVPSELSAKNVLRLGNWVKLVFGDLQVSVIEANIVDVHFGLGYLVCSLFNNSHIIWVRLSLPLKLHNVAVLIRNQEPTEN